MKPGRRKRYLRIPTEVDALIRYMDRADTDHWGEDLISLIHHRLEKAAEEDLPQEHVDGLRRWKRASEDNRYRYVKAIIHRVEREEREQHRNSPQGPRREHLKCIVWPRQGVAGAEPLDAPEGKLYRYAIVGMLVCDKPIAEFEGKNEVVIDGPIFVGEKLARLPSRAPSMRTSDAADVLVSLGHL